MAREIFIPAGSVREEVRTVEEYPAFPGQHGIVKVTVGRVDDKGTFLVPQNYMPYVIEAEDYDKLCGDGEGWASPGKPPGTYRNEDLWYFIDLQRAIKP